MSQDMISLKHLHEYHHCLVFLHFFQLEIGTSMGPLSKSEVPDPLAPGKVIDRGYREIRDIFRKILHTRLVTANLVA